MLSQRSLLANSPRKWSLRRPPTETVVTLPQWLGLPGGLVPPENYPSGSLRPSGLHPPTQLELQIKACASGQQGTLLLLSQNSYPHGCHVLGQTQNFLNPTAKDLSTMAWIVSLLQQTGVLPKSPKPWALASPFVP